MVRPPRENAGSRLYQKDGTIFFSVNVPLTYSRPVLFHHGGGVEIAADGTRTEGEWNERKRVAHQATPEAAAKPRKGLPRPWFHMYRGRGRTPAPAADRT